MLTSRPINDHYSRPVHDDPPAVISQVFGPRSWWQDAGNTAIHRIGVFRGLGWTIRPDLQTDHINGVRVVCLRQRPSHVFTVTFGKYVRGGDTLDLPVFHKHSRYENVDAERLRKIYAGVLGEAAL